MKYFHPSIFLFLYPCFVVSQPLSTAHFDEYENWPLVAPGDLKQVNQQLEELRIQYDAPEMGGPGGTGFKLYIDVIDVMFNEKEALWIQWTFSHKKSQGKGTPVTDIFVVDRQTSEYLFRLQPNAVPGQAWAGPYGIVQAMPDVIREIRLNNDGTASLDTLLTDRPIFDFAALGFFFPFVDFETNPQFRIERYHSPTRRKGELAVKSLGDSTIYDINNIPHKVNAIQVMPISRSSLVTYYVSNEAPFFYGWDYKTVEDGVSIFKMNYIGWRSTSIIGQ